MPRDPLPFRDVETGRRSATHDFMTEYDPRPEYGPFRCEGCGRFARDLFDNGGELPDGRYEALYLGRCCAAPTSIRADTPEKEK